MVCFWPRNEVFDAVLPLSQVGARREVTPAIIFSLVAQLRTVNTQEVKYTTWVTESWRFLQWAEPQAKLFWENLTLLNLDVKEGAFGAVQWGVSVQSVQLTRLSLFLLLHITEQKHCLSPKEKAQAFSTYWPTPELVGPPDFSLSNGTPNNTLSGQNAPAPLSPTRFNPARGEAFSPKRMGSPGFNVSPTRTPPMSPTSHKNLHWSPLSPKAPGSPSLMVGMSASSPRPSPSSRHHRLFARSSEEAARVKFIKRHLPEALLLAANLDVQGPSATGCFSNESLGALELTAGCMEPLTFLLGGGEDVFSEADFRELFRALFEAGKKASVQQTSDFLQKSLIFNEVQYPSLPTPTGESFEDTSLHSPTSFSGERRNSWDRQHITGNLAQMFAQSATNAPLVFNTILRTTIVHDENQNDSEESPSNSPKGELRAVQINHCHDSYIYVLGAFKSVAVFGCTDCTIVVGVASSFVSVVECERVQFVTCCRRLFINNCLDSVFPVFVQSSPVLVGDNRTCQLAPFNTNYPGLTSNLEEAGLPTKCPPGTNFWSTPLDLGMLTLAFSGRGTHLSSPEDTEVSSLLLPPDQFYCLTIPHSNADTTTVKQTENPFVLPAEYQKQLIERDSAVRGVQKIISESNLSEKQQREVEEAVNAKFLEWLLASGNLRQVLDLIQQDKNIHVSPAKK